MTLGSLKVEAKAWEPRHADLKCDAETAERAIRWALCYSAEVANGFGLSLDLIAADMCQEKRPK